MKYHINPRGDVRPCTATIQCRYGMAEDEHYATEAEAREAYERSMSAVPELAQSDGGAEAFARFAENEPLSSDDEEMLPSDPEVEASLPPEEFRGLSQMEVEEVIWEHETEEYEWRMEQERMERTGRDY